MVQRCCVPFCETKVGDADINGVKVRFHRMPMVPERFQQWRSRITSHGQYKPEPELTSNSRICSKHFLKQDYLDNCHKPVTGNHILSKDALPSKFRWSSANCDVSAAIPFVRRVKPAQQTHHSHHQYNSHTYNNNHHHHQSSTSLAKVALNRDDSCIEHSAVEKQTQCSFEDERLKNEISRKNSIIQQLLERISQLEAEHKATTQILLKESITGSGAATSVIRAPTSSPIRESGRDQESTIQKRRKLQQQDEDDENIHYVLLSLSEKVVRHDSNVSTATST
ncbi:unnamed protein product [Orchesella dallaii]|uniref:THAP-type domain-containing protein n=1 Tax=Orchesella dallaii TaxID=48710 RepID=A0ABP1RA83_9HEXA